MSHADRIASLADDVRSMTAAMSPDEIAKRWSKMLDDKQREKAGQLAKEIKNKGLSTGMHKKFKELKVRSLMDFIMDLAQLPDEKAAKKEKQLVEILEKISKMKKTAAKRGSWDHYVELAQQAFLKEAAKGVNKLAGPKGKTKLSKDPAYLTYTGVDTRDLGLDISFHLIITSASDAVLSVFGKSAKLGNIDEKKQYKWGVLEPGDVAVLFHRYFA